MASRGRTPIASDNFDRSYESSPDPLALSFNESTTKSTRKSTPRKPLATTSPTKQNRRSSISEMQFSSPSKAMVMNTPRMGNASPWRIKVTVEAEPESDEENKQSPSVKRITRTQTTTVPLKDPDASSPVKRGRGRPRKSDVGATPKIRRAGTPIKRAARSRSREASVGARESSAADIDTDAPPKRKRGRPRKNAQTPLMDEDIVMVQESQSHMEASVRATPMPLPASKPSTSQKSTRFATPDEFVPHSEATDATPRPQPRLGKGLNARKGTPHSKRALPIVISSDEESDHDSDVLTPESGEDEEESNETVQSSHGPQPDAYALAADDYMSDPGQPFEDEDEEIQDATNFAFDEGTTRMPDDTTVMDSENFTMISVHSLPSSGGLTSPPKAEDSYIAVNQRDSILQDRHRGPSTGNTPITKAQAIPKSSPKPPQISSYLKVSGEASRPALRRYITPINQTSTPSEPPVIEPTQIVPPKSETPRLGRVVTAGVALQGLLDPSRMTPESSQKMLDEKRDRLDDLFRGFSEGTRRELQAGLRLGEQLATGQPSESIPPVQSSPVKPPPKSNPTKEGVYKTQRKHREPRLLTPEDQVDDIVASVVEPDSDVQYPTLPVAPTENSLPSPARSDDEDEMSWRVDTPPVATEKLQSKHSESRTINVVQHVQHGSEAADTSGSSKQTQQEDYSDIWQEEASRSSDSAEADQIPQVHELFEPGPVVPNRGKLPRTWRRKSGNHFQYSDEAESPQQSTHAESVDVAETNVIGGEFEEEEDGAASEASDDTGMFFQSNMPNIFSKRHSRDLKQKKADKLDLTLLMNEGESLAPESSPPVITKKPSSATKTNPFLNTPPRFSGFPSSPQKSSPLRRELHGSDISSETRSRFQEESSLPLAQSSPFHTYVDGESKVSVASDQRQLQMEMEIEMEGVTDSSIRYLRNEADGYLEAYEPQERSLDWIEEVTEPSRTWHKNTTMVASSPPQMKMLSPVRKRNPLFQSTSEKLGTPPPMALKPIVKDNTDEQEKRGGSSASNQEPTLAAPAPPTEQAPQRPCGLLTRMTSSLWSAVAQPVATATPKSAAPAPHPILAKLTPLPKIEPWTKTHYKTLDRLYSVNQKHPALFSPSIQPSTPLSQTNTHLLNKFLAANEQPYVGAVFSAWGYEFDMTEELVVLCQVFCELMSLDSIAAYEKLKGREIEMGDCLPGRTGDAIGAEEVMRRLATVILGEEVRADEKRGVKIDRSKGLEILWPQ